MKCLLIVSALAHFTVAHSADLKHLSVGQQLPGSMLSIGRFQLQLPEGPWALVSKSAIAAGSQSGSSATPVQLVAAIARVESGKATAILIFRTPANTFQSVNRWRDDPCGGIQKALVKDTMRQTFAMPECFAITTYSPAAFTSATTGAVGDVAAWLTSSRTVLPENILRVYYTKYHGGDFLHANMYLQGTPENLPKVEAWGRQAANSLQQMVNRGAIGVIPSLPELVPASLALKAGPQDPVQPGTQGGFQAAPGRTAEARILELKSLLDKGLISADDYNEKREKILDEI
jgi:hypothetical protein